MQKFCCKCHILLIYTVEDELCISFQVFGSRGLIFASRLGINKTEGIDGWVNSAAKSICIGMPRISATYTVVEATDSKETTVDLDLTSFQQKRTKIGRGGFYGENIDTIIMC